MGTQSGREVSVINTFELKFPDSNMDDASTSGPGLDMEFLEKRRAQCKSSRLTSLVREGQFADPYSRPRGRRQGGLPHIGYPRMVLDRRISYEQRFRAS